MDAEVSCDVLQVPSVDSKISFPFLDDIFEDPDEKSWISWRVVNLQIFF